MSVRAYLVKEDVKMIDGKRYVHEEHEYLWNNWHETEIWNILWPICNDMTNEDCIGIIEINEDAWEDLKEDYDTANSPHGEEVHQVIEKHKDVFQKIDSEFANGADWIIIKLY